MRGADSLNSNSANQQDQQPFHLLEKEEVLKRLETREEGLTSEQAAQLLERYGKNMLQEAKPKSLLAKFIEQFKNVMIFILLAAAVLSGILGEWTDTIIILLVVILNAVLGVIHKNKAEQAPSAEKHVFAACPGPPQRSGDGDQE